MTRLFSRAAPLVALLAAACLNDAPVAPRGRAAIAVAVHLQQAGAGSSVHARVYYFLPATEQDSTLFDATFPIASGSQQLPASFDVAPCLAAQGGATGGSATACNVFAELQLLVSDSVVDDRVVGPITVHPGETVASPPVYLVAGNNAPRLTGGDTAVWVGAGLVRYRVGASDVDGDLLDVTARVLDSAGTLTSVTTTTLPIPRGSLPGWGYATLSPVSGTPATLEVYVDDTKGNLAGPASMGVSAVGQSAPFAYALVTDTTHDSLSVGFQVSAGSGTPDSVDLVVRNVLDSLTTQDTVYFVCGSSFAGGAGAHTVACPRLAAFTRAQVIAVPFDDQGNWGSAAGCFLPGDCSATARRKRN